MVNENKKKFFKELNNLIKKMKNEGVSEKTTIALVYQTSFKYLEVFFKNSPFKYHYTEINTLKDVVDKNKQNVFEVSSLLINLISESEPFEDLMSDFIEDSFLTNTALSQHFSPKDISNFISSIHCNRLNISKFKTDGYYKILDDCSGAGSLSLNYLRNLEKNVEGFQDIHFQSIHIELNEIDTELAKISFFQIVLSSILHNKPIGFIQVNNINSLTKEFIKDNEIHQFIANFEKKIKYDFMERNKIPEFA